MNTIQNIKIINVLLVVSLLLNIYMLLFPNTNVVVDSSYKQELAELNNSIKGYKQEIKALQSEFAKLEQQYNKQDSINTILSNNLNNLHFKIRRNEKQLIAQVDAIRSDGLYINLTSGTELQHKLDSIVQQANTSSR